ncbi:MAG TPA: hypothetical protein VLT33_13135 [Labilithrix sp.]|nr:hypothetical protein [Labilithrix sp.]
MNIPGGSSLDRSRRVRDDEHESPARPASVGARPADHDGALSALFERLPTDSRPVDYAAMIAAVAPPDPAAVKDAQVRARMDACRDAASGPYSVAGQAVAASPMFRMTPHVIPQSLRNELRTIGLRASLTDGQIRALEVGQGSSGSLVKMTQALIDAGKLPPAPADLAARIKTMQWTYGIGMDCAGYSKVALRAAHGRSLGFYGAGIESFRDLDGKRSAIFARVPLAKARPGDLITLDPSPGGTYGHNVVVYGNDEVDAARRGALSATYGAPMAAFLSSPGPHRLLQVDSSWGAGAEGNLVGGYRRDTWLYDASTKSWASFAPGTTPPQLVVSKDGPSDDRFHGVYRPR